MKKPGVLVATALAAFVLATLAVGSWWGFPVQDDTYMVRLLRLGGPDRIVQEHPDRPAFGLVLAACARIAGEHRAIYILIALAFWATLAGQAARLWFLMFPRWSGAWPAVALAVVAPVVTLVQFTTVTTVVPCGMPVVLVLGGLLVALGRPDRGPGPGARALMLLLPAAGAVVSEYALAAACASGVLLLLLRRWRGAMTICSATALGYLVLRALGDVTVRRATNPAAQLAALSNRPWSRPIQIASATWHCVVGAWGGAVSNFRMEWGSTSTLLAAVVGLAAAALTLAIRLDRDETRGAGEEVRRVGMMTLAVAAGLTPAVLIQGWPLARVFETRFLLPVLAFASCATVAALLVLVRPRYAKLVVFAVVFLSADRLVLRAFEEKRLQADLQKAGERIRPLVDAEPGLVVVVSPDRIGVSGEEQMGKLTYGWSFPSAGKFWILRPDDARLLFGPRSGCQDLSPLRIRPQIRWPRTEESIRAVFWDASTSLDPDLEPYYRGCPDR